MTQFAYFDSTVTQSSPVLGWYDTGIVSYPQLPLQADLLVVTSEQWDARMHNLWAVSDGILVPYTPPPPVLTLIQQAQNLLSSGLLVSSTSVSGFKSTYAIDAATQGKIAAISTYILVNSKFPGGLTSYPWLDMAGTIHEFTSTAMFQDFATVVADYVSALDMVIATGQGPLPVATATIA